jgi:hypothetical protein
MVGEEQRAAAGADQVTVPGFQAFDLEGFALAAGNQFQSAQFQGVPLGAVGAQAGEADPGQGQKQAAGASVPRGPEAAEGPLGQGSLDRRWRIFQQGQSQAQIAELQAEFAVAAGEALGLPPQQAGGKTQAGIAAEEGAPEGGGGDILCRDRQGRLRQVQGASADAEGEGQARGQSFELQSPLAAQVAVRFLFQARFQGGGREPE